MRRIAFKLGLSADYEEQLYSERALAVLVHALVQANVAYLRSHRAPPLETARVGLDAAVRAVGDDENDEWKGIAAILATGADPVSLACWRCAERIGRGEAVRPVLQWSEDRRAYRVAIVGHKGIEEQAEVYARCGLRTSSASDYRPVRSTITFVLRLFRSELERAYSERVLSILLGALTAADVVYLDAHPETPRLYEAGVRYRAEAFPKEEWKGLRACLEDGEADCEDLASWRCAELVRDGEKAAAPVFRWRKVGPLSVYHILVRRPSGQIEDPSLLLGMRRGGVSLPELMRGALAS